MSDFSFLNKSRPLTPQDLGHHTSLPAELGTGQPENLFEFEVKQPRNVAEYLDLGLDSERDDWDEAEYQEEGGPCWGDDL